MEKFISFIAILTLTACASLSTVSADPAKVAKPTASYELSNFDAVLPHLPPSH